MKLYLASFLEPENFGPGRIIGVANGSKPNHIEVNLKYNHFIPSNDLMKKYRNLLGDKVNSTEASKLFVTEYSKQLKDFEKKVLEEAKKLNTDPIDILPFEDGDTLASWEREKYTNYRSLICNLLQRLGFDVILK